VMGVMYLQVHHTTSHKTGTDALECVWEMPHFFSVDAERVSTRVHVALIRLIRFIRTCDITLSYGGHDSFVCVT